MPITFGRPPPSGGSLGFMTGANQIRTVIDSARIQV
jgi:hypothetical protein